MPLIARHCGSIRLRDISGHHIAPLPDAPQNMSQSDKAGRKSKPDTGNERKPERQNARNLNQRERGEETRTTQVTENKSQAAETRTYRSRKRQRPRSHKTSTAERRGKHPKLILNANKQREDRFSARNRTTRKNRTATTRRSENELCQRVSHAQTGAYQERPNTSSQIPNLP